MCRSKCKGGLGFKDLRAMNLALLGKQCWRLATNSSSLFYKVFKGKYFRLGKILLAELESNPSWACRSILEERKVTEKGLRWRMGNGNSIKIYEDPRLPTEYPFSVIDDGSWNENLI